MLYLRLFGLCGQTYADGGEYRCCKCKRMHRAEHDRGDKTCRTADDGYDSKHGCSFEPALFELQQSDDGCDYRKHMCNICHGK